MSFRFDSKSFGARLSAVLALFSLAGAGCGQPNVYQAPPPPEVTVSLPIQQEVTSYVEQTGTAQASERVELRARVSGFLVERNFEDGHFVSAGQLLFVIDEEPFKVRLKYARARENEAVANLKKAQQSKAREIAQAQLNLSEAEHRLAKVNHERNIGLLEQNALSRQEYDKTEAALRTAESKIRERQAELEQAQVDYQTNILSAQASLELAQSEVQTAEIDLGYCRVTSPIDGRIDRRAYDIGNYVTENNQTILASIVRVDPIYAYAAISEEELIRIKKRYQQSSNNKEAIPVLMGIGDDRAFPFEGTIDYIAPSVQTGTGTVQIRGTFKNTGLVMPGMFIRIRVPVEIDADAILVSERSLGYDQAGTYVYVVNTENVIERRSVIAGDAIQGNRVISGDVKPDDKVVADGLLKVRPGMTVSAKLPEEKDKEQSPATAPAAGAAAEETSAQ